MSVITNLGARFFLTLVGIFMIGSLPYLLFDMKAQLEILYMIDHKKLENTLFLYDEIGFNLKEYVQHIGSTFINIIQLHNIQYYSYGTYSPLFPELYEKYLYSMKYLVVALVVGILLTIIITYLIMLVPKEKRKPIKFLLFTLESLPDIFVILIFQLLAIWIYKATGLALFNVSDTFGDPAYFLPVFILSFLPTIYMVKYLLISFEEEADRLYVELARGKGLTKSKILLIHIFRNAFLTFVHQFKSIFWLALSSLLMMEIILGINGFTLFISDNIVRNPEIMTIGLLLIFIPYFLFSVVGRLIAYRMTKHEGELG